MTKDEILEVIHVLKFYCIWTDSARCEKVIETLQRESALPENRPGRYSDIVSDGGLAEVWSILDAGEQLTKVRAIVYDAYCEGDTEAEALLPILDAAIAKPVHEPVAYWDGESLARLPADLENIPNWSDYYRIPLYRHPREWQGLSDEEIEHTMNNVRPCEWQGSFNQAFARAIESALRAKNTGEQA